MKENQRSYQINNSDDYDEKYMKIKFNSDDHLPLKQTLEFYNIIQQSIGLFSIITINKIHEFSHMIVCTNRLGKV